MYIVNKELLFMKKIISGLIAFLCLLGLCSCSEKPVDETAETADDNILSSNSVVAESVVASSVETTTFNSTEPTTSDDPLEGLPDYAKDVFEGMLAEMSANSIYYSDFYGEKDFRADRPQSDFLYYFESHDEQEIYTSGDYEYYILKDGSAALRNYTGKLTHVNIPSTIDGRQVKILFQTFWNNYFVREVVIPDTVEALCDNVFTNCYLLKKVEIPESVIYIGTGVFSTCYSLEEIKLPSGVIGLETSTFIDCHRLKKINLENVRYIGPAAFMCTGLEEITIPENVEFIGRLAFCDCWYLKKVNFNDKLVCIDENAFKDCKKLVSLEFPDSLKEIRDYAFVNCYSLTTVRCPADIAYLGKEPFGNCDRMTLKVTPNTKFEAYAKENSFKYVY